jgi:hypothetical protein
MQLSRSSAASRAPAAHRRAPLRPSPRAVAATAFRVELVHEGKTTVIEVPEGETILDVALDKGLDLPHGAPHGMHASSSR